MKRPAFTLFTLLLIGCSQSYDVPRKIPKQTYTPPGTVWLKDNLFMDKTEMTNTGYREFLYWTYRRSRHTYYDSMLPDTNVWGNIYIYGIRAVSYYFRHPRFSDYPVVGIKYYQAVEYCKWRADRVNEFLYIKKNHVKWNADTIYHNAPRIVNYRLPTAQEWEYAASAGLEYCKYPLGYERILDKHNVEVSNTGEYNNLFLLKSGCYVSSELKTDSIYFEDYTQPVYFGKPNKFRIYNMLGNVSEIIADSLYKGLNYREFINTPGIFYQPFPYNYKVSYKYKGPQSWLGFRCIAEVLKQ